MRVPKTPPDDLPVSDDGFRFPLGDVPSPEGWSLLGACRPGNRTGASLILHVGRYFPDDVTPEPRVLARCATCVVREPCLEYAMRYGLKGIWGGFTEAERRTLKNRRTRARRALQRLLKGAA